MTSLNTELMLLILSLFLLSCVLTWALRRYALTHTRLLDLPNARSHHSLPVPRAGGLAIIVCFIIGLLFLYSQGLVGPQRAARLIGASCVVGLIGYLDDYESVSVPLRLMVHAIAAGWVLLLLGGVPSIEVFGSVYSTGGIGYLLSALYLIWMLNLYNFMDGIDGLAGLEALTVCISIIAIHNVAPLPHFPKSELLVLACLAAAVLGFLLWNFPRPHIFMGDSGSGFLGIVFGATSLHDAFHRPRFFYVWLILLGVFIVDATVTLLVRLVRRENVFEAHRSHAYQNAAERIGKHAPVTLAIVAINVFWLFPLALAVAKYWMDGLTALIIAFLPLVMLVLYLRAGRSSGAKPHTM